MRVLEAELLDFLVVILTVEDVPLLRAFEDGAALVLDLQPGGLIDLRFLGQQFFQDSARLLANGVAVFEELDVLYGGESISYRVGQLVDFLAADALRLFASALIAPPCTCAPVRS